MRPLYESTFANAIGGTKNIFAKYVDTYYGRSYHGSSINATQKGNQMKAYQANTEQMDGFFADLCWLGQDEGGYEITMRLPFSWIIPEVAAYMAQGDFIEF